MTRFLKIVACVVLAHILFAAVFLFFMTRGMKQREKMRAADLPKTVAAAQPILQAIRRYERDHQTPPPDLRVLTPRYLKVLPDAGPMAQDGWQYDARPTYVSSGWALWVWVGKKHRVGVFPDAFVYHSSGAYPQSGYGGIVKREGDWGYYVE